MIPDPRIIDNIKKLKELGMSENDIRDNLLKMNLSPADCDELILTASIKTIEKTEKENNEKKPVAKDNKKEKQKTKEEIDVIEEEKLEIKDKEETELPDNLFDENVNIEPLKEEEGLNIKEIIKEAPDVTKGLDFSSYDYQKTDDKSETATKSIVEDIWSSGLATTINTKLNEIDIKQNKFEEYIKKKISEEVDKLRKIQETSKHLLISKIDEEVTEKTGAINTQLIKQLAQIKIELVKINKKAEEINSGKKEVDELIKSLQTIQTQVVENNTRSQENITQMIATTSVKLNSKIKEINDILALQSKITQGLIKNTQTTITDEVKKLSEFKEELNNKVNPQLLYDKLSQLETFKQQLASRYETRFENVRNEFLVKAREAFKEEIESELKEVKKVRETIVSKTDPEIINKKLDELDGFQTQLLSAIDEKISQSLKIYESAINQNIKTKIKTLDEEISKVENAIANLEVAKEKVNELNQFREQFLAIIDKNIEKMNNSISQLDKKIKEIEEKQKMLI